MSIAQALLPEFDHEMATTRRLLERVPEGNGDWKPHAKSMSLDELANHVATIAGYANATLDHTEMNLNPPGGEGYQPPRFGSSAERLAAFDDLVRNAREAIARTTDEEMFVKWSLRNGEDTLLALPRVAVLRSFLMNHLIHHRAQLSVYIRMLDIPVPSIYGPSADEPM